MKTLQPLQLVKLLVIFALFTPTLDSLVGSGLFGLLALPLSIVFSLIMWFQNPGLLFERKLSLSLFIWLIVVISFSFVQGNNYMAIIGSGKDFLPFIFFLLGFSLGKFEDRDHKLIIKWLYLFCYLQVPVTLLQVMSGIPLGDDIGGTFGFGQNQMLLFAMVIFNIISTARYLTSEIALKRYALELLMSLIPVTLASTVFSYILLCFHLLLTLYIAKSKPVKFINLSIMGCGMLVVLFFAAIIHDAYRDRGRVTSYFEQGGMEKVLSYGEGLTKEGTYGRVTSIGVAWREVCDNTSCIGYGLGSSNVGSSLESTGIAELKHVNRKIGRTQVSFSIIELGVYLGTALILILISLVYPSRKLKRQSPFLFYIFKLSLFTLPILFIYQKPLNFVFTGFVIALFISLPLNALYKTECHNES